MKTINKLFLGLGLLSSFTACSDFEDINTDPTKTPIESTLPEYFLNNAIGKIQMDPSTGERVYYLNWGDAARTFGEAGMLSVGLYDDAYMTNFYYPCLASTITYVTTAINEAAKRAESEPFYKNVEQFGRIWRAMVIAQFADSFGPYPLNAAQGENPTFNSVEETYFFILSELQAAAKAIDTSVNPTEDQAKCDPAYGFVASKWLKLANSLRMRYAIRLNKTNREDDAQKHFEEACKGGNYIKDQADMLWFKSDNGWNDYTSPYTRTWNLQALSVTMANLMNNFGDIKVETQRPDLKAYVKANNYMGIRYDKHFVGNTDDPAKQYWLDGIPEYLDPRALKMFWIVNDKDAENAIPSDRKGTAINPEGSELLLDDEGKQTIKVKGSYTWNGVPTGSSTSWSPTLSKNRLITTGKGIRSCYPLWGKEYCIGGEEGLGRVVFFGAWESYFLVAEAALNGWSTDMGDKAAYEAGVRASFDYFGISEYAAEYLASERYNRVGTSVSYDHTTEPSSFAITYKDGYNNNAEKQGTYNYPDASKILYKGQKLNDKLTKIITQKYLAQMPYLVQEAWSDHRRLGLPFFDMTANEATVMTGSDMTEWKNDSWKSGQSWKYYPQRMRYPQSLLTSDEAAYNHAVELLGGKDNTMTPLWWSMGATK